MNNPEALFQVLQICGVLFACAAGVCMILAAALFFASRREQGQAPFAGGHAPRRFGPAPGGHDGRPVPYAGEPGATEVLRGRGRQAAGYGGTGAGNAAGGGRRQLTRFEIVKENILIHSDEEITRN